MGHSKWAAPKAHGEHTGYGRTRRRDIGGPGGHLAKCESFEGHSMRAWWEDGKYQVLSYDQVIAEYDPTDGTLHMNEGKYTPKTTEHQNSAHAWTGRNYLNEDGTYGVQYEVMWPQGI